MIPGINRPRFFGRRCTLEVFDPDFPGADFRIRVTSQNSDDLRIRFRVSRDDTPDPDTAEIVVFNVAQTVIRGIRQKFKLGNDDPLNPVFGRINPARVRLLAGYSQAGPFGIEELIFQGDLIGIRSTDTIGSTETGMILQCGDGADALQNGFMSKSFSDVTLAQLVKAAGLAMNLAIPRQTELTLQRALAQAKIKRTAHGWVAQGKAKDVMSDAADSLGLKWWVQDGQVRMAKKFEPEPGLAVVLGPKSGLLDGTAELANGDIEFQTLLDPRIRPGRQLQFTIPTGSPAYRVDAADYQGDTHGPDWYVSGVARKSVFTGV